MTVTWQESSQQGVRTGESRADGTFVVDGVRLGHARVVASASGYDDAQAEVTVDPRPIALELVMKRAIKPGQLRGLVRSFTGKPLAATIRVEPLGAETSTDAKDGTFQIDRAAGLLRGRHQRAGARRTASTRTGRGERCDDPER